MVGEHENGGVIAILGRLMKQRFTLYKILVKFKVAKEPNPSTKN